jgi:hypothetical protein
MKRLWRWLIRGILVIGLGLLGLLSPVIYNETMCRSSVSPEPYAALLPPEHHRPETRTLMTYPEWQIVHAYEDYGEVLRNGDPHDYTFMRAIGGFWASLCSLSKASGQYGEVDGDTKQMVYVIGVSFTAELLLKAAYEETLGRLFSVLRGSARSALDDLYAQQASDYATFLQQIPWYKWPFAEDVETLQTHAASTLRDRERQIALGLEFTAKAAYAEVIAQVVSQVGPDELTLRMIVTDASPDALNDYDGVTVIAERPQGIEIETLRYRALTHLMQQLAGNGISFVEIAGNDDILFTALSMQSEQDGSLYSAPRQGFDDFPPSLHGKD